MHHQSAVGQTWNSWFSLFGAVAAAFHPGVAASQTPRTPIVRSETYLHSPEAIALAQGVKSAGVLLVGLGDSLTHGTMDATNNDINTQHAYLQLVADSLAAATPVSFSQPLFDQSGERIDPRAIPTNLGVDGADIFSMEGIEYYKRVGAAESFITDDYLCEVRWSRRLDDKYDKVLYPINLETGHPVSQVDAAIWLINEFAPEGSGNKAFVVFWGGNNDSSTAALGSGGDNPLFLPVPADLIADEVTPLLRFLLRVGPELGLVSFDSYTQSSIERNLTDLADFEWQYNHLLDRFASQTGGALAEGRAELLLLTLPYYSSIGYLFDSDDLEFYLRQVNPAYTVPPTFARVAPDGGPITDPTLGDRVSLLTFGLMYLLLDSGYSPPYVNQVLEISGEQRDGLVLSYSEQQWIATRIDGFNAVIEQAALSRGSHVHLIDTGGLLNAALNGTFPLVVNGRTINRKWTRGGGFTLDGVHPGYTGQAFIANYVLSEFNSRFGLAAPLFDLDALSSTDPYWDKDGDGWAMGADYAVTGIAEMLYLLTDSDDNNPMITTTLPPDVWTELSRAILKDLLGIPALREEAIRNGFEVD